MITELVGREMRKRKVEKVFFQAVLVQGNQINYQYVNFGDTD